jgi:hypothetical protein
VNSRFQRNVDNALWSHSVVDDNLHTQFRYEMERWRGGGKEQALSVRTDLQYFGSICEFCAGYFAVFWIYMRILCRLFCSILDLYAYSVQAIFKTEKVCVAVTHGVCFQEVFESTLGHDSF